MENIRVMMLIILFWVISLIVSSTGIYIWRGNAVNKEWEAKIRAAVPETVRVFIAQPADSGKIKIPVVKRKIPRDTTILNKDSIAMRAELIRLGNENDSLHQITDRFPIDTTISGNALGKIRLVISVQTDTISLLWVHHPPPKEQELIKVEVPIEVYKTPWYRNAIDVVLVGGIIYLLATK
jgi:hypothetical protein